MCRNIVPEAAIDLIFHGFSELEVVVAVATESVFLLLRECEIPTFWVREALNTQP